MYFIIDQHFLYYLLSCQNYIFLIIMIIKYIIINYILCKIQKKYKIFFITSSCIINVCNCYACLGKIVYDADKILSWNAVKEETYLSAFCKQCSYMRVHLLTIWLSGYSKFCIYCTSIELNYNWYSRIYPKLHCVSILHHAIQHACTVQSFCYRMLHWCVTPSGLLSPVSLMITDLANCHSIVSIAEMYTRIKTSHKQFF